MCASLKYFVNFYSFSRARPFLTQTHVSDLHPLPLHPLPLSDGLLTFLARQVYWQQLSLSEEVFPLHSEGYRSQDFLINTSNILLHSVLAGMVSEGKLDIIFIVFLSR